MREAVKVSNDSPVLLDRFLNDAEEVDVDAVCDGEQVLIGGIMEHVEQAGVHSGDSACSLPPYSLCKELQDELRRQTVVMAKALGVVGLMNVQFAIQGETVYVLEVNPRASRTVPFVSKARACSSPRLRHAAWLGAPSSCRAREGSHSAIFLGQGSGVSVHQVSGRRYHPRAGNEVHRRSDGRG